MTHKPIQIKNLSLVFPHKTCFKDFTIQINYGNRIAIIGRNGSGKSTLLKLLQRKFETTSDDIKIPEDVIFGYVPQVIETSDTLSGGQRLNAAITQALCLDPNVLLLDEPTNHLDQHHRKGLMKILKAYSGTLIIVSHDTELLRHFTETLWRIDHEKIEIFSGNYDDYILEKHKKRFAIEKRLAELSYQKKEMHSVLMKEQKRAAKSKAKGKKSIDQRKWPSIVSKSKALRGEQTSGRKKAVIENKKQNLNEELANLRLPEIILPKFSLESADIGNRTLVSIREGSVSYSYQKPLIKEINLSLTSISRIAITGDNGSGKTTLIKAMLDTSGLTINDELRGKTERKTAVYKQVNEDFERSFNKANRVYRKSYTCQIKTYGQWCIPKIEDIGYLDQHYSTLCNEKSVFDSIAALVPNWSFIEIRDHLSHFLFRKNEEVHALVRQLSGGEKVRLSLAKIAAKTPKLLLLDEITNNLDLETKTHVIQILRSYPGAIIIISHDCDFLKAIGIVEAYKIAEGTIHYHHQRDE